MMKIIEDKIGLASALHIPKRPAGLCNGCSIRQLQPHQPSAYSIVDFPII
jgi:TPP-dependent indolepyruvate ferredoxin oxidoreductase alpha subunit